MTETETEELGKRAVACKHWEWMGGMKMHGHGNVYRLTYIPGQYDYDSEDAQDPEDVKVLHGTDGSEAPAWGWPAPNSGWLPDLEDPATVGCLLHLVRKAWGDENAFIDPRGGWRLCVSDKGPEHGHNLEHTGETEAEALVAALEAAP